MWQLGTLVQPCFIEYIFCSLNQFFIVNYAHNCYIENFNYVNGSLFFFWLDCLVICSFSCYPSFVQKVIPVIIMVELVREVDQIFLYFHKMKLNMIYLDLNCFAYEQTNLLADQNNIYVMLFIIQTFYLFLCCCYRRIINL